MLHINFNSSFPLITVALFLLLAQLLLCKCKRNILIVKQIQCEYEIDV